MARYTGPVCRICRRETAASKTGEKIKLFLKGDRCLSKKCAVERRGTAPGQKTQGKARQKISEYGRQLREKQKMRKYYGVHERQFENYFREAARVPGQTGRTFLQLLERRLDNVVYRLNLACSRAQARQLVTHRHFLVNGRRVNIPSYILRAGDVITIADRSKSSTVFQSNAEAARNRRHPEWLELNEADLTAKVLSLPSREQIDTPVDEQLIVEYYSR
ncbi:MAG: 30S ribosomal protein S4 [Candidatus Eremiobacteraeota bacterium]|nr:30S ribosomal protein S4 [Candidatus Eremiobacteraeota bacterium]MBV8720892.1 30S ribosomal protein S4 [Candidatus Eremiobacteraeota bacterium]